MVYFFSMMTETGSRAEAVTPRQSGLVQPVSIGHSKPVLYQVSPTVPSRSCRGHRRSALPSSPSPPTPLAKKVAAFKGKGKRPYIFLTGGE